MYAIAKFAAPALAPRTDREDLETTGGATGRDYTICHGAEGTAELQNPASVTVRIEGVWRRIESGATDLRPAKHRIIRSPKGTFTEQVFEPMARPTGEVQKLAFISGSELHIVSVVLKVAPERASQR